MYGLKLSKKSLSKEITIDSPMNKDVDNNDIADNL